MFSAPARSLLRRDEVQHVARCHLGRLLGDDREEHVQVVRVRPHRVRPHTPVCELQELVDLTVTHTPRPITISARHAPERRGPPHRTPPARTNSQRRFLRASAQVADHPYKCRSGNLGVASSSQSRGGEIDTLLCRPSDGVLSVLVECQDRGHERRRRSRRSLSGGTPAGPADGRARATRARQPARLWAAPMSVSGLSPISHAPSRLDPHRVHRGKVQKATIRLGESVD